MNIFWKCLYSVSSESPTCCFVVRLVPKKWFVPPYSVDIWRPVLEGKGTAPLLLSGLDVDRWLRTQHSRRCDRCQTQALTALVQCGGRLRMSLAIVGVTSAHRQVHRLAISMGVEAVEVTTTHGQMHRLALKHQAPVVAPMC